MSSASSRRGLSLSSWLLLGLVLLLIGAAAAVWAMSRFDAAARFFGVAPAVQAARVQQPFALPFAATSSALPQAGNVEASVLEGRIARLEATTAQMAGSTARADALLIAFAARRAVERGVALGYLEPLLTDRFGGTHRRAVATVITGARSPVRLEQLTADFDALGGALQGRRPDESVWAGVQRELQSLVSVRRADRPNSRPMATYARARAHLASGQVDQALAEAMRLPGIGRAEQWVADARTYLAMQRAFDEIESAALLPSVR